MNNEWPTKESLQNRIEQLEHERDDLRKDIEQLCMQQAGPSYLAIATRMHFQRMAGLEQEIEVLKKKLSGCLRENQNIHEELSEAYRIKAQLADLYNAEVLKTKEAEDQLKFFQGCVASALSQRDHSLMEAEKAKNQEEAMSEKLLIFEQRFEEFESTHQNQYERHAAIKNELGELKEKLEIFEKVVNKFYAIREQELGPSADCTWQSRSSCLLDDSPEQWIFNCGSRSTTSSYIASLEEEIVSRKEAMEKMKNNLRMGIQIEQHLKTRVHFHEKKNIQLIEIFSSKLSSLCHTHNLLRSDIVKLLEEEMAHLEKIIFESRENPLIHLNCEPKRTFQAADHQSEDIDCKDGHITNDAKTSISPKGTDIPSSVLSSKVHDLSDALSQALQEKVATLLLLSQQEERHLLERDTNSALQQKIGKLQKNLAQVMNEKIEALMDLAQLKQEYQILHDRRVMKCDQLSADKLDKSVALRECEGTITAPLKKKSWRRWMSKDHGACDSNVIVHNESSSSASENYLSMDFARLKVENAALQESLSNMEHLTSSVHRLHVSLLKVRDDASAAVSSESLTSLSSIRAEASKMKSALSCSLPVSWSSDPTADSITYQSLYEPSDQDRRTDRVVCTAALEMLDLLILAAQFLQEKADIK